MDEKIEAEARKAFRPIQPEEHEAVREALWKEVKRGWHHLGQLETGLRELRKSLPEGDPLKMRLLTLETMARIGLIEKRKMGRSLTQIFTALLGECPFEDEDAEEVKNLTPAEVDAELKANGIDPDALQDRLSAALADAKAQRDAGPATPAPAGAARESEEAG